VILWTGAYVVTFAVYALLSATPSVFPSDFELARFLILIGTKMERLKGVDAATVVFVVARACILASIAEELLFHGALFGWLRGHLPAGPTIRLTAVGFTGIHGMMTTVPLALIIGIAAGCVRERTGSVTLLIIVHIIQNVVIVFVGVWSMQYIG
jgi:membrane protease YdiL (CAAX protease family)